MERGSRPARPRARLCPGLGQSRSWAAAALTALLLSSASGCHLMRSPFSGPQGLSSYDSMLRGLVRQGRFEEAYDYARSDHAREAGDELLALLNFALVAHYAGHYKESNQAFQKAETIVDERFTRSASRALLSLVTSDLVLPYVPSRSERWMINYYGALNYLAINDLEEAAVEARRLSYLLDQAEDRPPAGRAEAELRRALRYFAGSVFEAAGEWNDAAVAFRHVWPEGRTQASPDLPQRAAPDGDGQEQPSAPPNTPYGTVLVVVESGFVAHREERFSSLGLFPEEAVALGSSDERLRHSIASCVAARSFHDRWELDRLPGEDGPVWRIGEEGRCLADGRGSGFHRSPKGKRIKLRIAWPRMRRTTREIGRLRLATTLLESLGAGGGSGDGEEAVGSGEESVPAVRGASASPVVPPKMDLRADLSGAVIEEFEKNLGSVIVKTIARSAAKYAIVGAFESRSQGRVREKGEEKTEKAVKEFARLAAAAAVGLFERADTRSWKLLPDRLRFQRLPLPTGRHEVRARASTLHGVRRFSLGTVEVRPARVSFVERWVWP